MDKKKVMGFGKGKLNMSNLHNGSTDQKKVDIAGRLAEFGVNEL